SNGQAPPIFSRCGSSAPPPAYGFSLFSPAVRQPAPASAPKSHLRDQAAARFLDRLFMIHFVSSCYKDIAIRKGAAFMLTKPNPTSAVSAPLHVLYTNPAASFRLSDRLGRYFRSLRPGQRIAVVCLGTDRSTGDALGPLA